MTQYKIVASDLDGTLLNSKSQISEENLKAISELSKRGVYFVPSSGRTLSEIPAELRQNPDIRYIIHSNGAVVFDKHTGERISMCIEKNLAKEVLDVLNSYDTHIAFRSDGECYVNALQQTEEDFKHYKVWICHKQVIENFAVFVEDFKDFAYSRNEIEVFSVCFHRFEDKEECKKILQKNSRLRIVEAWENNLEIFSADAGKGRALHCLCDKLGVDYNDTISLGDSDNDMSITKAAGLGLAMGNAIESLKQAADEVICTNDENVVQYVLRHYIEN